ncbi:hypothetical protein BU17DRAFT_63102 [Hysterangium stoloniferum]|nr:hypothetical protein BU17DRAFT_63102 [Hysterangium stoloniferum]
MSSSPTSLLRPSRLLLFFSLSPFLEKDTERKQAEDPTYFVSTPGAYDFGLKTLSRGRESPTVQWPPERSFTAVNGVLWLRDILPEVLPSARILTYGYDARTQGQNKSQQTLDQIVYIQNEYKDGRSSHMSHLRNHKAVEISTYGVIFMGTPHQGINLLDWTRSHVDGRSLESLIMGSTMVWLVPGAVDTESLGIHKTHIEMVKFPSKEDGDYNHIVFQLQQTVDIAPSHIALNWMKHEFEIVKVMVDLCKKVSDWLGAPDPVKIT